MLKAGSQYVPLSALCALAMVFLMVAWPTTTKANACPEGNYATSGIGWNGCAPIPGYNDASASASSSVYSPSDHYSPPSSAAGMADQTFSRGYYQSPEYYVMMNVLLGDPIPEDVQRELGIRRPDLPEGSQIVHESATGSWVLLRTSSVPGQGCTVSFTQNSQTLILSGPDGRRPGAITFMGPRIPGGRQGEAELMSMRLSADARGTDVKAIVMRAEERGVAIIPTVIEDTLASIGDNETVNLELEDEILFSVQTHEAFKARDALQECLAAG